MLIIKIPRGIGLNDYKLLRSHFEWVRRVKKPAP